ncbi:MAG: type II toxin-antitoxin system RelE/ParE family toxin [Deltaproteobacteria bacterium]|nr:type II toxin-antitoxin system RelE/ParE family toxin [Deltaproteobacteria bacterium]
MPTIGRRVYELRENDEATTWRVVYRIDGDAIVIVEVFEKEVQKTPKHVIETCQRRLKSYDEEE